MADRRKQFQAQVCDAQAAGKQLAIVGQGSKIFLRPPVNDVIEAHGHRGIVHYDPAELVLTARAGTALAEVVEALAEHRQYLPFEPPMPDGRGTLGGAVASGWSGAGRPWQGAVRDYVLGLELLNGRSELLRFGGQVMKNVAGFDVARLNCGALGALGVITEVSIKVLPQAHTTETFEMPIGRARFFELGRRWARAMTPVTGLLHDGQVAHVRLSGEAEQVAAFARKYDLLAAAHDNIWSALQTWQLEPLAARQHLWRLCVPAYTDIDSAPDALVDWCGAQYWWQAPADVDVQALAQQHGGHAYACFTEPAPLQPFPRCNPVVLQVQRKLKHAFDPQHVFAAPSISGKN